MSGRHDSIDVWLATLPVGRRLAERWFRLWPWRTRLNVARRLVRLLLFREILRLGSRFEVGRDPWFERLVWHLWPRCLICWEPLEPETVVDHCDSSICAACAKVLAQAAVARWEESDDAPAAATA